MTDPSFLAVAAIALGVAVLAGWFMVPSPPALDGERWFKMLLATLLRGEVEAEGGNAEAWERRVLRFVPYHPAGRLPEQKVADPTGWRPPGLSEPGEIGLLEALARFDTPEERWEYLYRQDEIAIEARLSDPLALGDSYDPSHWVGPGGSWDDVADWGAGDADAFREALARRLGARWALVEGPDEPRLLEALAAVAGDPVRVPFPASAVAEGGLDQGAVVVREALEAAVEEAADRLVLAAEGEAAHLVLRALVEAPGLRDRVLAVASVGGVVLGRPGDDGPWGRVALEPWMERWFTPEVLDTEVNRATAFFHLAWFDPTVSPPGVPGLPVAATRFPPVTGGDLSRLEVVDLGLLPADDELPARQVARALWSVVVLWVLARG